MPSSVFRDPATIFSMILLRVHEVLCPLLVQRTGPTRIVMGRRFSGAQLVWAVLSARLSVACGARQPARGHEPGLHLDAQGALPQAEAAACAADAHHRRG